MIKQKWHHLAKQRGLIAQAIEQAPALHLLHPAKRPRMKNLLATMQTSTSQRTHMN
jgi:hypothetical protein